MTDFDYDVIQKKRLASNSFRRKRGSKSKKCSLSTDHMTKKQWKERCGELVSYNFNEPMLWSDFCKLYPDVQKEYITNLINKYSTTATDLAGMFGVKPQTVLKFCSRDDINIKFSAGKRMSKENKVEFSKFVLKQKEESCSDLTDENISRNELNAENVVLTRTDSVNVIKNENQMRMNEISMSFSGNFDKEMIYNSIAYIVPKDTPVTINIRCLIGVA